MDYFFKCHVVCKQHLESTHIRGHSSLDWKSLCYTDICPLSPNPVHSAQKSETLLKTIFFLQMSLARHHVLFESLPTFFCENQFSSFDSLSLSHYFCRQCLHCSPVYEPKLLDWMIDLIVGLRYFKLPV